MVARGTPLPDKLHHDAIVEALLEIQFETDTLPERFIGRITDEKSWKTLPQLRLPAYDMPPVLRLAELRFRYMPIIQVSETGDEPRALRIGPNVLSYHRTKKYIGWNRFKPELEKVIDLLFNSTEALRVTRLGLRYLNALTPESHGIDSIDDLDMVVNVASDQLHGNVNLNYNVELGQIGLCTVRVATHEFVQGPLPQNTSAYIDIDVFTTPGFTCTGARDVKTWLEGAHTQEKVEFFHLLTLTTIDALKE